MFGNFFLIVALSSVLCSASWAAELPENVAPPSSFDEGVQTGLSDAQLQGLLPWATNSKFTLEDLVDLAKRTNPTDAKNILINGIRDVVLASAPRQTELLMRYSLNRALKIIKELEDKSSIDTQLSVLHASVEIAIRYYNSDLEFLQSTISHPEAGPKPQPYTLFGLEYVQLLMGLDKNIFNAAAQYNISIMALGLFQWDLYRDETRAAYAPAIWKLNALLKKLPPRAGKNDQQVIQDLRELKLGYEKALAIAKGVSLQELSR